MSRSDLSSPCLILSLTIPCLALATAAALRAATIQRGDVTSSLGPTFFVDDAANSTAFAAAVHQPAVQAYNRHFNGLLSANQGPTRITITGLGFAANPSAVENDATSITATFIYLGPDEMENTVDDVMIGNVTGTYAYSAEGEYAFAFDSPLTADLDITGTRFRILLAPSSASGQGSMRLQSGTLAHETFTGTRLSVAGFVSGSINPQRVNLAKFQPVTTTSVMGQRLATYVTDGVTGNDNRWQGSNSQWQSAQIDFPFPVEVGSAQVFTGVNDTSAVGTFYLQYFNGSTWVSIPGGSVTGNTNVERNLVFTRPVTASSFRILGEDGSLNLRELALYPPYGTAGFPLGTDLTVNLAYQRPAIASASTAGNFALHAVDGRATAFMWQTTSPGTNTLEIDLRVSTRIGSAHLYSGAIGGTALADFVLQYWDGAAWRDIPGGAVAGNTTADLVVPFTTPVTTTKVRLQFPNPGTTAIRELCIFPANTGNVGYPLGTNLIDSGKLGKYEDFNDAFYLINNPASGRRVSIPANGIPALDTPGLTFGQSQYQVLLNLSNGTYRLRNRASGNCLSGARLDKTPGLPLTDAPYAALPHQDWILDPLGGGGFRIVNQWSGLAIDSEGGDTDQGTLLVQNTANSSPTQRWGFSYYTLHPKKGLGHSSLGTAFGAQWAYNWGRVNAQTLPVGSSFHPMQWGSYSWDIGSAQGPIWQNYPAWRTRSDGIHLLGFNEPDAHEQSNIEVNTAVSLWPRLQELDLPLVSPAPAGVTNGWLSSFYTQAENLGYRVDYTGVHTYPGPSGGSADNLISFLQTAYNNWNRPVWLTEFSFVDWNKNQRWSEEDTYNCLAEFLWRAENLPELRKYALFLFAESAEWPQPANSWTAVTPAPRSNSYDSAGNMTAFGKLYAAWDGDATVRADKRYMIHHRGLRKRMANAATTNTAPGGRTIRTDGPIVGWSLVSTGVSNRYYVVSSIDGRRLSYVAGSGNPNNDPALAPPGTSGVNVEWSLTHTEHGWHYLGHPHTGTRLKMISYNTGNTVTDYQLVSSSTADASVQWRFIVPMEANTPPLLAAIPDQTVIEGGTLIFTASATDADLPANTLAFSLMGAPAGALINADTGVFTWTPTETQVPGTYHFTVRVSDGSLTQDQPVQVTVHSAFSAWTASELGALPAGQQQPDADPDLDGLSNFLEYALHLAPLERNAAPAAPELTPTHPRTLQLRFLRARPELTYEVLASSTLEEDSWTVIATNPGVVSTTIPVTITDPEAVSDNPQRFLRIRITP